MYQQQFSFLFFDQYQQAEEVAEFVDAIEIGWTERNRWALQQATEMLEYMCVPGEVLQALYVLYPTENHARFNE